MTMFVSLCHTLFGVKDAFVFAVDSSFLMIFGTKIKSQIGTFKTAFFAFFRHKDFVHNEWLFPDLKTFLRGVEKTSPKNWKSGGEIAKKNYLKLKAAKNNICHPKISKHAHVWKYETWSPTELDLGHHNILNSSFENHIISSFIYHIINKKLCLNFRAKNKENNFGKNNN